MATYPRSDEPQPSPEVVTQLHAMGLASEPLREAARDGHDDAMRCTENDVATRPGYLRWATPLRYLGDVYVPKGWTRERPQGFEQLVNPDRTFALAVAPGSYSTGTERMPSTRIDRGPLTGQAVAHNRGQLSFDSNLHYMFGADPAPRMLWLLLHYFDDLSEEIRLELSVPVEFTRTPKSERGFVTRFEPRLILPAITLAEQANVEDEDEDDGDEQIEVPVARR